MMDLIRLQSEPIETEPLIEAVGGPADGAISLFLGVVRDHNRGRGVLHLEYEAYAEMAEEEMRRVADKAREKFEIDRVALVHRTGRLEIGEASICVAVSSAHRAAACEACRFIVDTLKETVPIWKKEFFEGGEVWIEGAGETPADPQA
jgi:molybdopterin synthase catalytic subunit